MRQRHPASAAVARVKGVRLVSAALGAAQASEPFGEVPPENLALIERHRPRLEAILEKAERSAGR